MNLLVDYVSEMFDLAAAGDTQGIWFWAAVYAALVCGYSVFHQLRVRRWPSTMGRLERLGLRKFGATEWARSEQDYVGDALYTYRVDGTLYEGSRVSPWVVVASHNARALLSWQQRGVEHGEDGGVRVYYDPARPGKSFLIVPGRVGLVVTVGAALVPAVTYLFRFHV